MFIKELEVGDIHIRDKWQFELKSEFFPFTHSGISTYTQEFYIFIPNALQINDETYSRSQFYQDQSNLIRYKTPEFQLAELYDRKNPKSPLTRLSALKDLSPSDNTIASIEDELKLFGNIVRSSLREKSRLLFDTIDSIQGDATPTHLKKQIETLCKDITLLRKTQLDLLHFFLKNWSYPQLISYWTYLDEFVSNSIDYYLTGLLSKMPKVEPLSLREHLSSTIAQTLAEEKKHRIEFLHVPLIKVEESSLNESVLYRTGLLNKFVLDALLLPTSRTSLDERFRNIIGGISAGLAMLVFLMLVAWQGRVFLINSLPFILLTVILYILKDRLKEGLKALSYRQFLKWFSDYTTAIRSADEQAILGKLYESFSFVKESKIPSEILRIRNREFHVVLETIKRPEQVIYYKKVVKLYPLSTPVDSRRNALSIIFRFNISNFLRKADDPTHEYVTFDPGNKQLCKMELAKVYHVNIILKNTYTQVDGSTKSEFRKFRLIVDKNGIRRLEQVS